MVYMPAVIPVIMPPHARNKLFFKMPPKPFHATSYQFFGLKRFLSVLRFYCQPDAPSKQL